jgi:hypothetical protein
VRSSYGRTRHLGVLLFASHQRTLEPDVGATGRDLGKLAPGASHGRLLQGVGTGPPDQFPLRKLSGVRSRRAGGSSRDTSRPRRAQAVLGIEARREVELDANGSLARVGQGGRRERRCQRKRAAWLCHARRPFPPRANLPSDRVRTRSSHVPYRPSHAMALVTGM